MRGKDDGPDLLLRELCRLLFVVGTLVHVRLVRLGRVGERAGALTSGFNLESAGKAQGLRKSHVFRARHLHGGLLMRFRK